MTRSAWRLISALLAAACGPVTRSTTEAPSFPTDGVVDALGSRWVYRGAVDWTAEAASLRSAPTPEAVVAIFAKADDVHSRVHLDGRTYAHFEGLSEAERSLLLPQLALEGEVAGRPEARLLADGVGYLLVPTIHADLETITPMAEAIRRCVIDLAAHAPRGWIVDLRLNGGGNLMPMLLGLSPLLRSGPTEVVAGTVDADGRLVQEWLLRGDELLWRDDSGERVFASLPSAAPVEPITAPVAVLIGPLTRSSGQALALAFRGRGQCALVGAPSARGYTTVTAPVDLGQGVVLSLAVGFMADRSGRAERIRVEAEIAADATVSALRVEDPAVAAGRAWIASGWSAVRGSG